MLLAALWGGNPVAVKVALGDVPPFRLACLRFVVGGLTILIYALVIRRPGVFTVKPGEWQVLWSLGLMFAVQIGLMNVGIHWTSAAHATVLVASYAVHTVVLAHFFIPGDRMTPSKLAGILVAYGGIVMLFARDVSLQAGTLVGDLIVSASALILGERTVYMAQAVQKLEPVKLLLGQSLIGSACFFLVSLGWESAEPTRYTASLGAALFYQGVVVAGFNFIVNSWLLQHYRPSALAAWSLTSPIFGVLIAAAVTGDSLTPGLLLSSAMVAAGIGLTSRRW